MVKKGRKEYVEVLEILKYIPKEEYDKIPKEEIEIFEKLKDEDYNFKFDPSKEIGKQNISKNTYAIFIVLYMNYISTEVEKKKVQEILELNSRKAETEKRLKYSNEIFSDKESNENSIKENEKENVELTVIQNQNIFHKLINKIKYFFSNL